ncbi:MAG: DUF948 domain-containing protein [Caldisericaceae bacterium]
MTSIAVALWVLVVEGLVSVILLLVFLMSTKRELENTLKNTQQLIQTLDAKVNALSDELENTLKNTTELTANINNTVKKTGSIFSATGNVMQLLPFLLTQRSETKEKSAFSTLITIARFAVAGIEGFKIINKLIAQGGKNYGGRQRK